MHSARYRSEETGDPAVAFKLGNVNKFVGKEACIIQAVATDENAVADGQRPCVGGVGGNQTNFLCRLFQISLPCGRILLTARSLTWFGR